MSLSCVSKRMTDERLNWQGRAEAVLKCRRLTLIRMTKDGKVLAVFKGLML